MLDTVKLIKNGTIFGAISRILLSTLDQHTLADCYCSAQSMKVPKWECPKSNKIKTVGDQMSCGGRKGRL